MHDRALQRVYSLHKPSSSEFARIVGNLCEQPKRGIFSSVGSPEGSVLEALEEAISLVPVVMAPDTKVPLDFRYDRSMLGADRIAAAVGARAVAPVGSELLVIDAGSCITIDRISAGGVFLGGNISPGIALRLRAMHEYTNRLPLVEELGNAPKYGSTTEEAMRSGVLRGLIFEMNAYIEEALTEDPDLVTILTGGYTDYFESQLKKLTFARRDLVLLGLGKILDYQYE